jgi:hypothetical protein
VLNHAYEGNDILVIDIDPISRHGVPPAALEIHAEIVDQYVDTTKPGCHTVRERLRSFIRR